MTSPEFQNLIRRSVKEGVIDGAVKSKALERAEADLAKTAKYKKWIDSIAPSDKAAALEGGLLTYLFKDQEAER